MDIFNDWTNLFKKLIEQESYIKLFRPRSIKAFAFSINEEVQPQQVLSLQGLREAKIIDQHFLNSIQAAKQILQAVTLARDMKLF